jgi:PAS domain S-box-containing protein
LVVRQRAAETLAEQRELLRVTLASIGDAVITTDTRGCVTYLNTVGEKLTGWASSEALGQPLDVVFHIANEETRAPVANPAKRALLQGVIVGLANHTVLIARDGSERAIDDSAAPIKDEKGAVVGCVLIFRDITERRRLEKENADRLDDARFLASIVESSGDAIVSKSLDGIIQTWNVAAERLFGYSAQQAIGRHISLIIPADRASEEEDINKRIRSGERVEHFETVRVRSDGSPVHISLTISPIKDEAGRVVGVSKIARDITDRKQSEEIIKSLNAQLANDLAAMTWMHEVSRRMIQAEDFPLLLDEILSAAIGITGADMGNIQLVEGKSLHIVSQRGFEPPFLDYFNSVCNGEGSCGTAMQKGERVIVEDVEKSPVFADSPELAVLRAANVRAVQSTPLIGRSGQLRGMFSTHYRSPRRAGERELRLLDLLARLAADLIESKQAEDKLRQSEDRFRSLITATTAITWTTNAAGEYVEPQPSWSEYTGQTWEELKGFLWVSALHPDDREHVRALWLAACAARTPYKSEGRLWHAATKSYRHYEGRGVPILNSDGSVREWVGRVIDVEDQYQAKKRVYDLMTELKEADRRKDEFLAVLAHELRGPLAPLRNTLEIMKRAERDRDLHRQARDTMERQLAQLVRLVDDLVDVSRITRNKIDLRKERVETASVLHQAIEACRPLAESAKLKVSVTFPPESIYLSADPVRLVQVFTNILNNACKYNETGGRIWLSAERRGSDAVVKIKDSGIGIPADKLDAVFEMFTQVDSTLDRSQGGLGIGLTLAKRLVEMHDGSVAAFSDGLHRGSEFVVRLPILLETPTATAAPVIVEPTTTPRRILIVDDNVDTTASLAMLLKITGNETFIAHDGLTAVEAAATLQPDVVLLDIGLPKLNGLEACRRIREQPAGQRMVIVALTGWGQEDDILQSKNAGFDHHMVKPIDYNALMKLLGEASADGRV